MKRLILVRHGKSSWKHQVPDAQRPLKKRAYEDANKIIKSFKKSLTTPAVLWTSYAVRALESAKIFREALGVAENDFYIKKELYTFDDRQLLQIIRSCDVNVDHLMVFCHNPAITEIANSLGNEVFDNVPTTGLIVIDFENDSWSDIKSGKTILYLFPKNL